MADKPSVWIISDAVVTRNKDAKEPTDTALRITASAIVKNGKPQGKTLNLTVKQMLSPDFSIKADAKTGTVTISRTEAKRGRGNRQGDDFATVLDFVKTLRS